MPSASARTKAEVARLEKKKKKTPPKATDTLRRCRNATATMKKSIRHFPSKLHDMLDDADRNGFAHIVSWCADDDGQSFQIHDSGEETFVPILRQYFRQTKYKSFLRQLQGYDIQRITKSGHNNNRCWHPLLLRGHRALCSQMERKKSSTKATAAAAASASAAVGTAAPTRTILSIPKSSSASLTPAPPHLPPTMVSLEEIMLPIENTINRMQANENAVFSDPETTGSHRNNTSAEELPSNYKDMKNTQQNSDDCTADASGAGVREALRLEIGCTVSSGTAVDSGRIDFDDTLLELVDFDVEEDLQRLLVQQHCQHPSSRDRLMGQWSKMSKNCTTNMGKLGMNISLSTTTNQNKNTNLDKTRTLPLANKKFMSPSIFEPIPIDPLPTSVNRNTIHSNNPSNTTSLSRYRLCRRPPVV